MVKSVYLGFEKNCFHYAVVQGQKSNTRVTSETIMNACVFLNSISERDPK